MRAVISGLIAGAVGTTAMDVSTYVSYRFGGGKDPLLQWEFAGVEDWDSAPAPAHIGKRVVEGLLQKALSDQMANRVNNVVHWAYGMAWAVALGIVKGSTVKRFSLWGPMFGTVVWLSGYAVLPQLGLYKPITEYDARSLGKDLSHHLVYGTVTDAALRVLLKA
jgi:hypothetical protein